MWLPSPALAGSGCNTERCVERVAAKQCSQTRVVPCIRRAAILYRQSFSLMRSIARCESGLNPYAYNGASGNRQPVITDKSSGLFQFMPGTFAGSRYAHRKIRWRGRYWSAIWSAKWNALAAGELLRRSGTWPWISSRHCWG